ncbi:MAG TPA: hypothetical protein EYG18_08615 [Micavibrio sp.]|nr:hypothetical protein [Micavibrio sp.]HIL29317.1 hypothetical protein [Micavibrio sp.]
MKLLSISLTFLFVCCGIALADVNEHSAPSIKPLESRVSESGYSDCLKKAGLADYEFEKGEWMASVSTHIVPSEFFPETNVVVYNFRIHDPEDIGALKDNEVKPYVQSALEALFASYPVVLQNFNDAVQGQQDFLFLSFGITVNSAGGEGGVILTTSIQPRNWYKKYAIPYSTETASFLLMDYEASSISAAISEGINRLTKGIVYEICLREGK